MEDGLVNAWPAFAEGTRLDDGLDHERHQLGSEDAVGALARLSGGVSLPALRDPVLDEQRFGLLGRGATGTGLGTEVLSVARIARIAGF